MHGRSDVLRTLRLCLSVWPCRGVNSGESCSIMFEICPCLPYSTILVPPVDHVVDSHSAVRYVDLYSALDDK